VKYKLHTIWIGQSTHWDLVKNSGLWRILFDRSCLRRILFHKKSGLRRIVFIQNYLNTRYIWFEVSYYVYQFIGGENDSNSNTEWSQRHSLYQTVIEKVSNFNKPFAKSNLLRYKSHNSILNSKTFYKKQRAAGIMPHLKPTVLTWPSTQIILIERTRQRAWLDALTTPLTRSQ